MALIMSAAFILFRLLVVSAFIMLPGVWWNLRDEQSRRLGAGTIAVPGIVVLGLFGAALWIAPEPIVIAITIAFYLLLSFFAIDSIRKTRSLKDWKIFDKTPYLIWAAVVVQTVAFGSNPLPVAQELYRGTLLPGRMVASPPDHTIPYATADYFFHHLDGREQREFYFGGWSVTSRGPLVPLGINTLFHAFGATPADPPNLDPGFWAHADSGAGLAQIYGWLTNTLVILGSYELLSALGVSSRRRKMALIWLALSPIILINSVYLWPKLFATYFVLLATADLFRQRYYRAGTFAALAWLSHPVGTIFVPCLGLLVWAARFSYPFDRKELLNVARAMLRFTAALFICVVPWLVYKLHLRYPDEFISYMLSDGSGALPAKSVQSWIASRCANFWMTLSPTAYFYSSNMYSWLEGPTDQVFRWTVQYAKTLPGQLGLSCFFVAYASIFSSQPEHKFRAYKYCMLFFSFFLMLLSYGFSADGLGRAVLEPLTVLVLIFACATTVIKTRTFAILMSVLWLENRWVELSGFIDEKSFAWTNVSLASWTYLIISSSIALGLVGYAWRMREPDVAMKEVALA